MESTRAIETTLNIALARLLRRERLEADGERSLRAPQYDLLLSRDDDLVAMEAEFEPARTVRADATSRMGQRVDGKPIGLVAAVIYPKRFRNLRDEKIEAELKRCDELRFSFGEPRSGGEQLPLRWTSWETGSVRILADHLWARWTQSQRSEDELARLARILDEHIFDAAAILHISPGSSKRVIKTLELDALGLEDRAALRAAALILCNAMVFQRLLSSVVEELPPAGEFGQRQAAQQWEKILRTNWRPIFEPARQAVLDMDPKTAQNVLDALRPAADALSQSNIPVRHDLAGRVFHRLLIGGKYLSPNYTTVPAAILLATLALDCLNLDWSDEKAIRALNIVDPACGTGTLLAAAGEDIRRRHLRSRLDSRKKPFAALNRTLLEDVLHGYDVVHAVVHLAAATLAMMEVKRKIRRTHLYPMPLKVEGRGKNQTAHLGSLDFLSTSKAQPWPLALFAGEQPAAGERPARKKAARSVSGDGEKERLAELPPVDLAILNPPFFKSQGIADSRGWKPFFGMMTNPKDAELMRKELQRRLQPLPASMKAGGSAFIQLVEENLRGDGSVLACVLPTAVWTGSSWAGVRRLWAERYAIEWVVVSHDDRNRTKTASTPGRRFISMSESTRIGETLIVARRKPDCQKNSHRTRIVNLAHNPDHPIEAAHLARQLSELQAEDIPGLEDAPGVVCSLRADSEHAPWGQVLSVALPREGDIGGIVGPAIALRATGLLQTAWRIGRGELRLFGMEESFPIPICTLAELAETSPPALAIKGRAAPCEMHNEVNGQAPALWHHRADETTTLTARPNAGISAKPGHEDTANALLRSAGHLHISTELGLASQRAAALWGRRSILGVQSWNTLRLTTGKKNKAGRPILMPRSGQTSLREKALALWLNSTPGILLRIVHGNRSYLGRVGLPVEVLRKLPVLNVRALSAARCKAAGRLWDDVAKRELRPYAQAEEDPLRQEIDRRLLREVLGLPQSAAQGIADLRARLVAEPMTQVRF
ncbi:MAG: hypothetical protein OXU92_03320 [Deltaproteobacteria bacterium]|nr:hypothetical protein [Deltaproteobacteria bacterium]